MNTPAFERGNSVCALSIVVPVYNEDSVLVAFHHRLVEALAMVNLDYEVIYVDDGSTDRSTQILKQLHVVDQAVGVLRFSRNFGKEQAMTAGLRAAAGDAVIVIDADLQHPPEMIPAMIAAWQQGADVVSMRRRSREGERWSRRIAARAFYRLLNSVSDVPIAADVGDFRLLSRRAVDALNLLGERNRFMKGLYAWIGFPQVTLDFDCAPRVAGASKWAYLQLWRFALEGVTAFSVAPLKAASYAGMLSALASFAYGVYFFVKALLLGDPVQGFPTLIVVMLFLGGLQLMAIGIVGEYLGRLCTESKRRPLYLIEDYAPAAHTGHAALGSMPRGQSL